MLCNDICPVSSGLISLVRRIPHIPKTAPESESAAQSTPANEKVNDEEKLADGNDKKSAEEADKEEQLGMF